MVRRSRKRKKKRKLTPHNKCMARGLKKGHDFGTVGSTCGRNPDAYKGKGR